MDWLSAFAVGILSIASFIYLFFKYQYSHWERKGIPFEQPSFPHGNLQNVGKTIHISQLTKSLYDKWKGKGKVAGLYTIFKPTLLLLDHDLIKTILIKEFNNFNERGLYYNEEDDPISAHLFSLDGKKWKTLRSKLTPTFTSGKMKFMFPTIVEVADRFRDCLASMLDDGSGIVELRDMLSRFTTDVIGTCAFGIECNSLRDPNAEFRNMGRAVFEEPRFSAFFFALIGMCRSLARFFHVKSVHEDVSTFFLKVVNDTVDYREKNNVHRNDFMDILIKLKNEGDNKLSMNEIAAQAFIFFLAGFETSSTTLTYALYELALNKDIQEKARREVRAVLEKHNGKFTYEAMMEMTYVEQIINETLRKYPPVTNLVRVAQSDYKIPGTDVVIDKGTSVWIPAYAIQHDPEYYPEPEKFMPERFSPEAIAERESTKWLPFGDGPRNCIGLRFGMMQTRIGLSTLLDSFNLSICDKTSIPLKFVPRNFILTPQGGVYLKFKNLKI